MNQPTAPDRADFRRQVRSWVQRFLDPNFTTVSAEEQAEHSRELQRRLFAADLAGLTVPTEYGGRGLGAEYEQIFADEIARNGVPLLLQGIGTCLPTLLAHGSEQLKLQHIPAMLRGDEVWVQLLSESAAGSDLASLVTAATRTSDGFALSGQKTWINGAQFADYSTCLARTDPTVVKHRGLTMFVVPLDRPGITVKPLRKLTGESGFCEVVLDDVEVSTSMVLGELGDGWSVAHTQMRAERNTAGAQGRSGVPAEVTRHVAALAGCSGVDTRTSELVAWMHVRGIVEAETIARVRRGISDGRLPPAATALIKLIRVWRAQSNSTAALDIGGTGAIFWPEGTISGAATSFDYLGHRPRSVSGGTTEIQLNAISERVLDLPREPRADLDKPFDEILSNMATSSVSASRQRTNSQEV